MAWFTRFTRFGDMHFVYAQEEGKTCGIACVMMVVFKLNKLASGKTATYNETQIYKTYSAASGAEYEGDSSTNVLHLASTLGKLNVGSWKAERLDPNKVGDKLVEKVGTASAFSGPIVNVRPAILLVRWARGGGHFVVVDTIRTLFKNYYAIVCDPWDGNVHVTAFKPGQSFDYVANQVPFSWDLGGKRHDYSRESQTANNRWLIYQEA